MIDVRPAEVCSMISFIESFVEGKGLASQRLAGVGDWEGLGGAGSPSSEGGARFGFVVVDTADCDNSS